MALCYGNYIMLHIMYIETLYNGILCSYLKNNIPRPLYCWNVLGRALPSEQNKEKEKRNKGYQCLTASGMLYILALLK